MCLSRLQRVMVCTWRSKKVDKKKDMCKSHCCLQSWPAGGGCGTVSGLVAVRKDSDRLKRIAIERLLAGSCSPLVDNSLMQHINRHVTVLVCSTLHKSTIICDFKKKRVITDT